MPRGSEKPCRHGAEVVESGREGWVVPARDVEALKDRLVWCYEHREETAQMGARAKEKAVQSFTWGHYGAAIFAGYQRVCGLRAGANPARPPQESE